MTALALLSGLVLWAAICTVFSTLGVPIIPGVVAICGFSAIGLAHACARVDTTGNNYH